MEEPPAVESAGGETYPIPANTPTHVVFMGGDGADSVVAGIPGVDREIYTNRFGWAGLNAGAGLIADDITTTAKDGCKLTHYSFEIVGRVNPNLAGGPFSVTYALSNVCPGAVTTTAQESRKIAGTQGTLVCPSDACPDPDARVMVVHTVATEGGTPIPPRVWLGMKFSRSNAGPVVGSPPEEGFSYDIYDTVSFKCETGLAPSFPEGPYAAFNARLWAGTALEPCPQMSIGYHSHREKSRTEAAVFNPGADKWVVDDLVFRRDCRMVGYAVTVTEQGNYSFEFRPSCDGTPYAGTQRQFFLSSTNNQTRNLTFMMNSPVNLGSSTYFAAKVSTSVGKILAGAKPIVGRSEDVFGIQNIGGQCVFQNALPGMDDALAVTVLCEGEAPLGACCDMYVPQCMGGPDDGRGCRTNGQCASPGTCERTCRQLSDANCTFPPEDTTLIPNWQPGRVCSPNPFPNAPCGVAACCHLDQRGDPNCTNLTENDCPPFGGVSQWQIGELCGLQQRCAFPTLECVGKTNSCFLPCPFLRCTGCDNPECCKSVCREDSSCCMEQWDSLCAARALSKPECTGGRPKCERALLINPPILGFEIAIPASDETDDEDPPVCCQDKRCLLQDNTFGAKCTTDANCGGSPGSCFAPHVCVGGDDDGNSCITHADCPSGTCEIRPPFALNTVWFKFVADWGGEQPPGININTCGTTSSEPRDSIIQLFAVGDPTSDQTACATLTPVGCSDDSARCNPDTLSRLCVSNLKPNGLYYLMVGAKTREAARSNYRLSVATSTCAGSDRAGEDWCAKAPNALDGNTPYTFPSNATLDCPGDSCRPEMTKDIWFNYTATCTGVVTIETCEIGSNPDTTLAVYKGCDLCPGEGDSTPYCNDDCDIAVVCPAGSTSSCTRVEDVTRGDCLKIRIGDNSGNTPNGTLNISCPCECDPGVVTFIDPPNGVVDAGRPHDPLFLDAAMGIREIRVQGPPGMDVPCCWRVDCESAIIDEPNRIEEVVLDPDQQHNPGGYIVRLARPISTKGSTIVRYLGNPVTEPGSAIHMTAHPGNVLGDSFITWDITIATLVNLANDETAGNPLVFPSWGEKYSADIDRSGNFTAFDVLDLINLHHGAETYEPADEVRPTLCTQP